MGIIIKVNAISLWLKAKALLFPLIKIINTQVIQILKEIGDWVEDMKQGKGEEIVKNKYKYLGDFCKGIKHGKAKIYFFNQNIQYEGDI